MQRTVTVHEDAWVREGPIFGSGQVAGYRIGGLPSGQSARIANFGAPSRNDWRIMMITVNNGQDAWSGHFESFQDALAALLGAERSGS
jgi:hypothetical protein